MRLAIATLLLAGALAGSAAAMQLTSQELKPLAPMPAKHV